MSYSAELSEVLTSTLARFATLNPHQLAGHVSNLDFWLAETRHCIQIIDGYRTRFATMKAAQVDHAAAKEINETPPKPVPDTQLKEARQSLIDAAYRFLVRCYKTGLIGENRLRDAANSIGTGVDVNDLKP